MKKINKIQILLSLALGLLILISTPGNSQTEVPKAQLPILTTSAGQSPDVFTVNIVAEEAGIGYDFADVPDVELLSAGVGLAGKAEESRSGFHVEVHTDLEKFPEGTPYKTVVFAIGASLKGMGASGLTVDTEVKRLENLIAHCKEKDVFVIGVHVGGTSKRGAPGSDNEKMIDAVAPKADYLIVTKDSNKDGRFTAIAKDNNIPLTEIEYALGLVEVFKQLFE
jgi:hypothetical protein